MQCFGGVAGLLPTSIKCNAAAKGNQTSRRAFLALGSSAAASIALGVSPAVSELVRLEDVESKKMQQAIRAAVTGDLDYAELLFSELLEEDATNASAWSDRGNVRISLGKYEQALEDFDKAITLAPQAPVPLLNRAIANEALGRLEDAIADCKAAIKLDPQEYAAWYNMGNVDVRVKDYAAALSAYEKAANLAPGIAGYRLKQALVLFQLNAVGDAKRLIQGLVRKYPNYAEAHAALAAILWSQARRSEAEQELSAATIQDAKFKDLSWIEASLQWPPSIVQAMNKLLVIDVQE